MKRLSYIVLFLVAVAGCSGADIQVDIKFAADDSFITITNKDPLPMYEIHLKLNNVYETDAMGVVLRSGETTTVMTSNFVSQYGKPFDSRVIRIERLWINVIVGAKGGDRTYKWGVFGQK